MVLAPAVVHAQRWGRPDVPRSGACFYRDINFRGEYFCLRAGEVVESLPGDMNDEISSIRTFGGPMEVTVFQNRGLSGKSRRFENDVTDLRNQGWNDRLSSLLVEDRRQSGGFRRDRDGFGNGGFGNGNGGGFANPDRIVRRAYQDILGREPDTEGLRLYRSRMIDDGWTEQQVREALRTSPEYRTRNTMTVERATEIVRQAYHNVLNREPDPGAQAYIQGVLRRGMTQQDIESELRRSPEFRNRGR
jgi:hypothetical protein